MSRKHEAPRGEQAVLLPLKRFGFGFGALTEAHPHLAYELAGGALVGQTVHVFHHADRLRPFDQELIEEFWRPLTVVLHPSDAFSSSVRLYYEVRDLRAEVVRLREIVEGGTE